MQILKKWREPAQNLTRSPNLIFSTELEGSALQKLLQQANFLSEITQQGYGLAMALSDLSKERAEIVRELNSRKVYLVGCLILPTNAGYWFNLQNYPQATEIYRKVHSWIQEEHLVFNALGLDIEPPISEIVHFQRSGLQGLARRLWLAHENVLYTAALAAYTDLIAEIRHDGYEVHTYQIPLLADDRRAGTTLLQRALDVVDLPADVEVLMCLSSMPVEIFKHDLGGALIASYGSVADGIGIGSTGRTTAHENSGEGLPALSWPALRRDLLLAAKYTDTIYIFTLEGAVEQGILPHIAQLDWEAKAHSPIGRRLLIGFFRLLMAIVLWFVRFNLNLFAWLGWVIALFLFIRQLRWRSKANE